MGRPFGSVNHYYTHALTYTFFCLQLDGPGAAKEAKSEEHAAAAAVAVAAAVATVASGDAEDSSSGAASVKTLPAKATRSDGKRENGEDPFTFLDDDEEGKSILDQLM